MLMDDRIVQKAIHQSLYDIKRRSCKESCNISTMRMLGSVLLRISFQITNDSMHTGNQELTQQVRTFNLEISHLQAEAVELRNSVGRSQSTDNRDAENLRCLKGRTDSLGRGNHRHLAEIKRAIPCLQETEMETARTQSLWENV